MRWKSICGGLALVLVVIGGCKQRIFMTEDQFEHYHRLPLDLATNPTITAKPVTKIVPAPPSVYDMDRKIRYLSLYEAISIALEQGTLGIGGGTGGPSTSTLISSRANGQGGIGGQVDDSIRVLAYEPAVVGALVEAQTARFDAFLTSSMSWGTTDQPIGTALQAFQAGATGLNAIVSHDARFASGVVKPLATGGTAALGLELPYQFTNLPARVNPSYRPRLVFGFDQPLLQGFGVEINQLQGQHPIGGNLLGLLNFPVNPNFGQQFQPGGVQTVAGQTNFFGGGILIARQRFDIQRAGFEGLVNELLLNVETAYWNLYGSYWTLYSREQALRQSFAAWRLSKARYEAGRDNIADVAQARGQYELFRAQRLAAVDQVLENERELRRRLGMCIEDGTRLVPSDSPTLAEFRPDWESSLAEALHQRPGLRIAREEVKVAQNNLIIQKNSLLPDLRVGATYDVNSIGGQLDGNTRNNALKGLASNRFNSWQIFLNLNVPIGYRVAHANVRIARLRLGQAYEQLRNQELRAQSDLGRWYRSLGFLYKQIQAQRAQREAFAVQIKVRAENYRAGRQEATLDNLLEAQRFWADALANEYAAIVQYNVTLANFEFAKGSIMQHNNVSVAEGPLPKCAMERAAEHFRERTNALILRERQAPVVPASCVPCGPEPPMLPAQNAAKMPTLMNLWKHIRPLKDAPVLPKMTPSTQHIPDVQGPTEIPMEELFPQGTHPTTSQRDAQPAKQPTKRPMVHPSTQPTAQPRPQRFPGASRAPRLKGKPQAVPATLGEVMRFRKQVEQRQPVRTPVHPVTPPSTLGRPTQLPNTTQETQQDFATLSEQGTLPTHTPLGGSGGPPETSTEKGPTPHQPTAAPRRSSGVPTSRVPTQGRGRVRTIRARPKSLFAASSSSSALSTDYGNQQPTDGGRR